MKYRQIPEDFIVEELADHKISKNGKYKLYILEKEGIETFELLDMISKDEGIPRRDICIAGIKDTYAQTKQYITIPRRYELNKLKLVGYVDRPLKLGDLIGNKFIITVREIEKEEIDEILYHAESIKYGIPNYFDSQRFGSVHDKVFIAKFLIKKDYEGAVKQYLTSYTSADEEEVINDKNNILESWPLFNIEIKNYELKRIIEEYKKLGKWNIVYKKISPYIRGLFISSYQSYLWNECIKLLLEKQVYQKELYSVPYAVDELTFFKNKVNLPETFQKLSHKVIPEEHEKEIIGEVLEKEGITIKQFNIRQSGNFFKSQKRDILIYPEDFEISKPVKDGNSYSMTVKFTLPKGCYATMVLKKIFGR